MIDEIIDHYHQKFPNLDKQPTTLLILLARTYNLTHEFLNKHAQKLGLSRAKFSILLILYRTPSGKLSMTDISNQMHVTRTNITKLVDGLENDGFVERIPDPKDRRSSLVALTHKGQTFMNMHLDEYFYLSEWLMDGLSRQEKEMMESLLYKLIGSLMIKSKQFD
jgi:DNA-binding MarR family transcriptional regulator